LLVGLIAAPILSGCGKEEAHAAANFGGDARRGSDLIGKYGCGSCHDIPQIAGAHGNVGPPLTHVGTRTYLAGFIRNSPDNMALWIQDPQRILPEMPCRPWASRRKTRKTSLLFCKASDDSGLAPQRGRGLRVGILEPSISSSIALITLEESYGRNRQDCFEWTGAN
jgi:hypothetical protein